MVTRSEEEGDLFAKAQKAFPWFDTKRLPNFLEAVRETAFQAGRIEAASQPTAVPDLDREHRLAVAILELVSRHIESH
jgi:hypothetical protein